MNAKELIKAMEHAAENRGCSLDELFIFVEGVDGISFVPQQLLAVTTVEPQAAHFAGLLPYAELPDHIDPAQADLFDVQEDAVNDRETGKKLH